MATHGFFTAESPRSALAADPAEASRFGGMLRGNEVTGMHPGLLTGLALAGANHADEAAVSADPDADDGLLTAEEIGTQNLDGVELVVLSACETGLGKSAAGEGVLGLQRSFQAAGVRTVVASLWNVSDQGTQTLMIEFYKNLWEKKLGKLDALRQAQLTMARSYDAKAGQLRRVEFDNPQPLPAVNSPKEPTVGPRQPLSPQYWAAFVLSGDWR